MSFAHGISNNALEAKQNISDAEIVSWYLGIYKIPIRICSPLRKDDKPSFGLYTRDGEHIYYTDFATGDKGHIIDLLMQMWNTTYTETWERISKEIGHTKGVNIKKTLTTQIETLSSTRTQIRVKIREWTSEDLEYWKSYGINKEWLVFADVYPISHIFFLKENQHEPLVFKADRLAYTFVEFKEGSTTYKVYQPLNKKGAKWFSSHDRSVISLWTKVPENGDKLVICSSLKDALCLWANTGIPAISPQGEGYTMSETAISELKRRYKEVYILYDNDAAGLKDGIKFSEQTGFTNLVLPYFTDGKDVSDLYKAVGKQQFKQIINNLIK